MVDQKNSKVPKLRFREFSGEWQEKELGGVSDVRDGTHESPKYIPEGKPLITSKNLLRNGELDLTNVDFISHKDFESINKRSGVSIGDILFGMIGTLGNPVRVKTNDFAIKNVALIKQNGELLNTYLIQYLASSSIIKQFFQKNAGGTQKFIALGVIRDLIIGLPEKEEQEKIAGFLGVVDEKIEQLQKKKELLEKYKKGIMQKIFSQQIRFKDENGKDYPDWEEKKLSDILNAGSKTAVDDTSKYKKITVGLHKKGVKFAEISRKMTDTRPFYIRKQGEIIIGKQNYFNGSVAVISKKYSGTICSNAIMSFEVKKQYLVKYVYEYISRADFLNKRQALANGTGQKELSESEFLKFEVNLPSLEEQRKIAEFLISLDDKIKLEESKLEQGKQFKKALLQQMFV